jgi:thymidylate kinase
VLFRSEALKRYQQIIDENPDAQIIVQAKKRIEELKKLIADKSKEKK